MFIKKEKYEKLQKQAEDGLKDSFKYSFLEDKYEKLNRLYESCRNDLWDKSKLVKDKESFEGNYDYHIKCLRSEIEKLEKSKFELEIKLKEYELNNRLIIDSTVNNHVNKILTEVLKSQDSLLKTFANKE